MTDTRVRSRKFRVTVDGETFEVEVEELAGPGARNAGGPGVPPPPSRLPAAPPRLPPAPTTPGRAPGVTPRAPGRTPGPAPAAPSARAEAQPPAVGTVVAAPLPGTVVSVLVSPGQEVKAGAVLLVLEAMKMQNEIVAPSAGKVAEVAVTKGDVVGVGDRLAVIG